MRRFSCIERTPGQLSTPELVYCLDPVPTLVECDQSVVWQQHMYPPTSLISLRGCFTDSVMEDRRSPASASLESSYSRSFPDIGHGAMSESQGRITDHCELMDRDKLGVSKRQRTGLERGTALRCEKPECKVHEKWRPERQKANNARWENGASTSRRLLQP